MKVWILLLFAVHVCGVPFPLKHVPLEHTTLEQLYKEHNSSLEQNYKEQNSPLEQIYKDQNSFLKQKYSTSLKQIQQKHNIPPNKEYDTKGLHKRIINAIDQSTIAYPFLATLENTDSEPHCAASLISPRFLITAAHCLSTPTFLFPPTQKTFTVTFDYQNNDIAQEGVQVKVLNTYTHPHYNSATFSHDIALLEIEPVDYTYALLVHASPPLDSYVGVIGWGKTYNSTTSTFYETTVLGGTNMRVLPLNYCTSYYAKNGWTVDESMQCVKGEGSSCDGDSGGPVFVTIEKRAVVVGVVSWGMPGTCGLDNEPSLNARVDVAYPWIQSVFEAYGETIPIE